MQSHHALLVTSVLGFASWGSDALTAQDRLLAADLLGADTAGGTMQSLVGQEVIPLPADDRQLDASFEEVYRLGSLTGDGWDAFGWVAGLGFDGAGNLYIFDNQAVRVYVVDQRGNLCGSS